MSAEPIAPQNLDAEENVLGAIMLASTAEAGAATVDAIRASGLLPEDFYRPSHGLIYTAALSLVERDAPTDAISLAGELGERLEQVGGRGRLHVAAGGERGARSKWEPVRRR